MWPLCQLWVPQTCHKVHPQHLGRRVHWYQASSARRHWAQHWVGWHLHQVSILGSSVGFQSRKEALKGRERMASEKKTGQGCSVQSYPLCQAAKPNNECSTDCAFKKLALVVPLCILCPYLGKWDICPLPPMSPAAAFVGGWWIQQQNREAQTW